MLLSCLDNIKKEINSVSEHDFKLAEPDFKLEKGDVKHGFASSEAKAIKITRLQYRASNI